MPIGDIFVHKGKASHFFHPEHRRPLQEVVSIVHDITSVATQFIKHYYLTTFFDQWESDNTRRLVIDDALVGKILSLVKSGTFHVRGDDERSIAARMERDALVQAYVTTPYFFNDAVSNKSRFKAWSLSFTLNYAAQQLATGYENNIIAHFSSYVKKLVVTTLRRNAMLMLGHERYSTLPVVQRRAIDLDAKRAFDDIIGRRFGEEMKCTRPEFVEWIDDNRTRLMPQADPRFATFDDHLENDSFAFLPFMVRINRLLEDLPSIDIGKYVATKLYSPLILRTSYIPSHIYMDTVSMLHLFVNDVDVFKSWYKNKFSVDLVNLKTKETLASSYGRLIGRTNVTPDEESLHADRCWEYVGTMPSAALDQQRQVRKRDTEEEKKKKASKKKNKVDIAASARKNPDDYEEKDLRFQRMVLTDAYNLSILLTTAQNVRGKVFGARKAKVSVLPKLDPDTSYEFGYLLPSQPIDAAGSSTVDVAAASSPYNLINCDPGKAKILYMTDSSGNTVIHTRGKRERQCRHLQTRVKTLEKRRKAKFEGVTLRLLDDVTEIEDPTIEDIETRYLVEYKLKSCYGERFIESLNARAVVRPLLKPFYEAVFFRSSKYAVYLGTKSCNDKLVDEIRNAFGKNDDKTIVILWGNWGQHPNALRNGPSTPGIGIRRMIHRRIANDTRNGTTRFGFTLTVCEMKTSSICNACGGDIEHIVNPEGEQLYRALRCQNNDCAKTWNRDDLGSKNIGMQGLHLLQHHSYGTLCREREALVPSLAGCCSPITMLSIQAFRS